MGLRVVALAHLDRDLVFGDRLVEPLLVIEAEGDELMCLRGISLVRCQLESFPVFQFGGPEVACAVQDLAKVEMRSRVNGPERDCSFVDVDCGFEVRLPKIGGSESKEH